MTGVSDDGMVRLLVDQLDDPGVTARRMFGGYGIYRDGFMFALVYGDAVYMKVSEEEAKTSHRRPFKPRPKQTVPTFREVDAGELEDREKLASLAEQAQEAAGAP